MRRISIVVGLVIAVAAIGAASTYFFLRFRDKPRLFSPENAPFPLVAISPGAFFMGSERGDAGERPVHKVNITRAFFMGATEVTQAQYRAVMDASPSVCKGDNFPVECVSWNDAIEFCRRLTEAERKKGALPEGMEYRLPTEAEWEYCCRAGSTTDYCFGDDRNQVGDYAWFFANTGGYPANPVATKKPNAWGLYDMHGNVCEWCSDWYDVGYQAEDQTDPVGPPNAMGAHVYRGGSAPYGAEEARSAVRQGGIPDHRYYDTGFRVVVAALGIVTR